MKELTINDLTIARSQAVVTSFPERDPDCEQLINELQKVNKQLAKLTLRKEELTNQIIKSFEHDHEGQKSYEHGFWKIEIKTPFIYSLNKKLYETIDGQIPDEFNPIKELRSYSIDKRLCEKYLAEAPDDVRDALIELIEKKPGKPSITIKERI